MRLAETDEEVGVRCATTGRYSLPAMKSAVIV